MPLTVNRADEKEPKSGSVLPHVLAPMIAKTAITRKRTRRAPDTGTRLASTALRMSRRDVILLMSRITRKALKSLCPDAEPKSVCKGDRDTLRFFTRIWGRICPKKRCWSLSIVHRGSGRRLMLSTHSERISKKARKEPPHFRVEKNSHE